MCGFRIGYTQDNDSITISTRDTMVINNSDFEDPIFYSARDSIYADLKNELIHLYGEAVIDNGFIRMDAGYIMIDMKNNEVLASYAYDSDSNKIEFPKFSDGSEQIDASKVRYNFNTEKAYIEEVAIQQDENFLYMGIAKKQDNDEIHFRKGRFTTCDLPEPHYHFQLSKAVMVPEKRIVSGPMNLFVKGVPTPLGLPFSIIPQTEERNQGFVFPNITPVSQYGFGFQDLGYYIPVNDRFQTTFYAMLYSRGSWGLSNISDYAKRYGYRGNLQLGYQQFRSGFPTNVNSGKTTIKWIHRQDAKSNPYWNFSSNVNFISDNQTQNNLDPINEDYFKNTLTSDINLQRKFLNAPVTAGAKISMRQSSSTGMISLSSPVINVNMTRVLPFKNSFKKVGSKKNGFTDMIQRIGVTYNFEGQNRSEFQDTLLGNRDFDAIGNSFLNGINHSAKVQTTASLFKNVLKLTPSFDYNNKINFQTTSKTYDQVADSLIEETLQEIGLAHNVQVNAAATTVLYSYFRTIGKNKPVLRHLLTPNISVSYRPNLNPLKSYQIDSLEIEYSPFENSLYRVSSTKDQFLLNFRFSNTLEMKRKSSKDTVTGFKKTRLIDAFTLNGNYDFMKDSMNLSDISLNLRVSPIKWLNFVATGTFSPYGWNDSTGARTSDYAINSMDRLGRFTRADLATTITLTSKQSRKKLDNAIGRINEYWNSDYEYYAMHPEAFLDFSIPWKVSLSHNYSLTANQNITTTNSDRYLSIQTLMLNGDLSFTKRWKVSTQTNLDLKDFKITNARLSFTRDMHCWALSFNWIPIGNNQSFLFSIRSTSRLFQDAKIELKRPPAFL